MYMDRADSTAMDQLDRESADYTYQEQQQQQQNQQHRQQFAPSVAASSSSGPGAYPPPPTSYDNTSGATDSYGLPPPPPPRDNRYDQQQHQQQHHSHSYGGARPRSQYANPHQLHHQWLPQHIQQNQQHRSRNHHHYQGNVHGGAMFHHTHQQHHQQHHHQQQHQQHPYQQQQHYSSSAPSTRGLTTAPYQTTPPSSSFTSSGGYDCSSQQQGTMTFPAAPPPPPPPPSYGASLAATSTTTTVVPPTASAFPHQRQLSPQQQSSSGSSIGGTDKKIRSLQAMGFFNNNNEQHQHLQRQQQSRRGYKSSPVMSAPPTSSPSFPPTAAQHRNIFNNDVNDNNRHQDFFVAGGGHRKSSSFSPVTTMECQPQMSSFNNSQPPQQQQQYYHNCNNFDSQQMMSAANSFDDDGGCGSAHNNYYDQQFPQQEECFAHPRCPPLPPPPPPTTSMTREHMVLPDIPRTGSNWRSIQPRKPVSPPHLVGAQRCAAPAICCHTCTVYGEFMVIIGGATVDQYSIETYGLHIPSQQWYTLGYVGGATPRSRVSPTACLMRVSEVSDSAKRQIPRQDPVDVIVVFGGCVKKASSDSSLRVVTVSWLHSRGVICWGGAREDLSREFPQHRKCHAAFVRKGKMIVLMGRADDNDTLDDMWELTLEFGVTSSTVSSASGACNLKSSTYQKPGVSFLAQWKQIAYAQSAQPSSVGAGGGGSPRDSSSSSRAMMVRRPVGRHGHSACYNEESDCCYMFGGDTQSQITPHYVTNDLWEFDFATALWRLVEAAPAPVPSPSWRAPDPLKPRHRYAQIAWLERRRTQKNQDDDANNDDAGVDDDGFVGENMNKNVDSSSSSSSTWFLYMHGGDNHTDYFSDTWRCNLQTGAWEPLNKDSDGPAGRSGHTLFLVPRRVFTDGGHYHGSENNNNNNNNNGGSSSSSSSAEGDDNDDATILSRLQQARQQKSSSHAAAADDGDADDCVITAVVLPPAAATTTARRSDRCQRQQHQQHVLSVPPTVVPPAYVGDVDGTMEAMIPCMHGGEMLHSAHELGFASEFFAWSEHAITTEQKSLRSACIEWFSKSSLSWSSLQHSATSAITTRSSDCGAMISTSDGDNVDCSNDCTTQHQEQETSSLCSLSQEEGDFSAARQKNSSINNVLPRGLASTLLEEARNLIAAGDQGREHRKVIPFNNPEPQYEARTL